MMNGIEATKTVYKISQIERIGYESTRFVWGSSGNDPTSRVLRSCTVSPYCGPNVPTSRAPAAEHLRPRAHPNSNAAEHGSLGRQRRRSLLQAHRVSARLRTAVMPNMHCKGSCFKLGFPSVGELGWVVLLARSRDSCQTAPAFICCAGF